MKYGDFLAHVNETATEENLVLRALGMTGLSERFRISHNSPVALSRPVVAVLSTTEAAPNGRNYTVLATSTGDPGGNLPPYPPVRAAANVHPPLEPKDFLGDFDEKLSWQFVSISTYPGEISESISLLYLEGTIGSLAVNGQPTHPPEMIAALDKLW